MEKLRTIERFLKPVLPGGIYARLLYHTGLGYRGPEDLRRRKVVHQLHLDALEQEKSGVPAEEIFTGIRSTLANEGIGSAMSENVFAVNADHEREIFPKSIIAKYPGYDRDPHPSGWRVYYQGEAVERDQYPEKFQL